MTAAVALIACAVVIVAVVIQLRRAHWAEIDWVAAAPPAHHPTPPAPTTGHAA